MILLAGLGNPGLEYETTRHNFGFLLLDEIAKTYRFEAAGKKFRSEVFFGTVGEQKIIALKPQTFMNVSGAAIAEAARFYKIPLNKIFVFHDDVDLAFGKIKIKIGGGSAGHNGLKSIDENLGSEYVRIRLGVGRPENKNFPTADYVLGKFTKEELGEVENMNQKIAKLLGEILAGRADSFLNKFHAK